MDTIKLLEENIGRILFDISFLVCNNLENNYDLRTSRKDFPQLKVKRRNHNKTDRRE